MRCCIGHYKIVKTIQIFKYQEDHAQWQQNKVICEQWLVQLNDVLKDGFLTETNADWLTQLCFLSFDK